MPLFEYKCSACNETSELLQKHEEGTPSECPLCNAEGSLERQLSLSSFQLKGGGWYKDGYSKKPTKKD